MPAAPVSGSSEIRINVSVSGGPSSSGRASVPISKMLMGSARGSRLLDRLVHGRNRFSLGRDIKGGSDLHGNRIINGPKGCDTERGRRVYDAGLRPVMQPGACRASHNQDRNHVDQHSRDDQSPSAPGLLWAIYAIRMAYVMKIVVFSHFYYLRQNRLNVSEARKTIANQRRL